MLIGHTQRFVPRAVRGFSSAIFAKDIAVVVVGCIVADTCVIFPLTAVGPLLQVYPLRRFDI